MMKVTHIITGLNTGGAEMMLYKLLAHTDKAEVHSEVISLVDIGPVGKKIQSLGIPVKAAGFPSVLGFFRFLSFVKKSKPDVIQTWMYHADLFGSLAKVLTFQSAPLLWNIRQSDFHITFSKQRTIWVARILAFLSSWIPEKIVVNSERGKEVHTELGYAAAKMVVIPNGFDTSQFHADEEARVSVRKELDISPTTFLIGYVARFDPQKDHETFIKAAKVFHEKMPEVHFVLCGRGVTQGNAKLAEWIQDAGIEKNVHLLGERNDIPRLTASFTVATLTAAYAEGFPNSVGEAMACGVPCVVTNVGDTAEIVADTGLVASIGSVEGIAAGWESILRMSEPERKALGTKARNKTISQYSIDEVANRYYNLYTDVCSKA